MADSLPGLGIVAAVLGVVITMSALGGPPEEIGHKVAAALVGTFLGILLCYGFLGPMAANIKKQTNAESEYFLCLRMGLLAFMKGVPPILALEAARRAIPHHVRPTFQEMDKACRKPAGAPAPRRRLEREEGRSRPSSSFTRRPTHHDDEHGGAWKVAYADFVTAMMALFIVLWLLSASEKVQKAVGGYFQDPTGKGHQVGSTTAGMRRNPDAFRETVEGDQRQDRASHEGRSLRSRTCRIRSK